MFSFFRFARFRAFAREMHTREEKRIVIIRVCISPLL